MKIDWQRSYNLRTKWRKNEEILSPVSLAQFSPECTGNLEPYSWESWPWSLPGISGHPVQLPWWDSLICKHLLNEVEFIMTFSQGAVAGGYCSSVARRAITLPPTVSFVLLLLGSHIAYSPIHLANIWYLNSLILLQPSFIAINHLSKGKAYFWNIFCKLSPLLATSSYVIWWYLHCRPIM